MNKYHSLQILEVFLLLVLVLTLLSGLIQPSNPLFSEPSAGTAQSMESGMENTSLDNMENTPCTLIDGVPYINQLMDYPNGCESVSAVMALQYLGFSLSVDEFIDEYLPMGTAPYYDIDGVRYGCNPWEEYPGDPRSSSGWGCYAPVIQRALNEYLQGTSYYAAVLHEESVDALIHTYIDDNIPVIFWATTGMRDTTTGSSWVVPDTGEIFTWIPYMHCLLLIGYDETYYYFQDPMETAECAYDKVQVEAAYAALGSQAVVILPYSR